MTASAGPSPESYGSKLTPEQHRQLLLPIYEGRVTRGKKGSNLEAYDVRAHLNRVFGFGNWDGEVLSMELIREHSTKNRNGDPAITVAYRAQYRLTVRATDGSTLAVYSEWAMGDAQKFPFDSFGDAHDFAMKTAESQALKRCAINLGSQFGLSLYRKGSLDEVVGWTLNLPASRAGEQSEKIDDQAVPDVVPEVDPDGVQHEGETPVEGDVVGNDQGPSTPPTAPPADAPPARPAPPADWELAFQNVKRNPGALSSLRQVALNAGTCPPDTFAKIQQQLAYFERTQK